MDEQTNETFTFPQIDWSMFGKNVSEKYEIEIKSGFFKHIVYKDIRDYSISPNWVAISMKDGTVHFHATKDITYIKSTVTKE